MKSIILVATHKRNKLLQLNLQTLMPQINGDTQCVVLDDSYTADVECQQLCESFNCHYLHTGKTKEKDDWRIPGYAFNIGVKQYPCDVVVLCCAEIYHVNQTVSLLLAPFEQTPNTNTMSIPEGRWDWDMTFTPYVKHPGVDVNNTYSMINHKLNTYLPFMIAVPYAKYAEIGGYDEDFIGACYDDNDFVERMILAGCRYQQTIGKIVHMFDTKISQQNSRPDTTQLQNYNRTLYEQRKGTVIRNAERGWGHFI